MPLAHEIRQDNHPEPIYAGCFDSSIPLVGQGYYKFQSSGWCANICYAKDKAVLGLSNGTLCWCGDLLPPTQAQVAKSRCDTPCQGYDLEECGGGTKFFTVWLTRAKLPVPNYKPDGISSSSTSSSTHTSTGRSSTKTTQNSQASSTTSSSTAGKTSGSQASVSPTKSNGSHDKHLGIILGVVLGVLALIALLFLLWFLRRRRRRKSSSTSERSPSPEEKETPVASKGTSDSERPTSTLGPLPPPPIFLGGPNTRSVTQTSTTTSFDQPFYTPLEGPVFGDHAAAELSAVPQGMFDNTKSGDTSEPTHTSGDERLPMSAAPQQTTAPHAMTRDSDGSSYHNIFTSEADKEVEDTGVGFMSVTGTDTSPSATQVMSGSYFNASNLASEPVGGSTTTSNEPGVNRYAHVGSVLVAIRDFVARSSDEVSLAKGDRVVLVERDNKYNDGWFLGQNTTNGKIGLFPEIFTRLR